MDACESFPGQEHCHGHWLAHPETVKWFLTASVIGGLDIDHAFVDVTVTAMISGFIVFFCSARRIFL